MTQPLHKRYPTPFESGNANQTTTWAQCIAFYEQLAAQFPGVLRFFQIGVSDNGMPLHAGVVSSDGVLEREALQAAARPLFFNNNGIHPGEPEGIDCCMALVRDFCTQPEQLAALGKTVFLFIPVYNVDGCLNRANTSRTDQLGPEQFGFRANGRNLDLNRDFIKCDSLSAQAFNRFFCAWDPDVMVDTHTSNGADYQHTMTLIHTQTDKLGPQLGPYLRETMLPAIAQTMAQHGWPVVPYVQMVGNTPEEGIEHTLEVPRFSTGYAALHHTIGFMPETHMLKPYDQRYASMRAVVDAVLDYTVRHGAHIQQLRAQARLAAQTQRRWPVLWQIDRSRPTPVRFKGFTAVYRPSMLGHYQRLAYDRSQPWEHDIAFYGRCTEEVVVDTPRAYLIPQAWREVVERLQWNQVQLQRLDADQTLQVRSYRIESVQSRATPYEGHMFHDTLELSSQPHTLLARAGDWLVPLDQPRARYAIETLEPQAHDSFFRWGFFNSILEKKEGFSDYAFEDTALEMLHTEPDLAARFAQWKQDHPALLTSQKAVLDFLFTHGQRFVEPSWRRYPVAGVL